MLGSFKSAIEIYELHDLGYLGDKFAGKNNRDGEAFTKERLDRAIGNSAWINKFGDHSVHNLTANYYDHNPLLTSLQIQTSPSNKEIIFRFEAT